MITTEQEYYSELLKHIENIKAIAIENQPTARLEKNYRYYYGRFGKNDKVKNYRNVIQGIIDTKKTLVTDSQMVTEVTPSVLRFADLQQLQTAHDIADILNDSLKHVHKINSYEILEDEEVFNALVSGVCVSEVLWDADKSPGLGDVSINIIDPLNFFPDPAAKKIEDCNYIFIKETYSPITLKTKYPDKAHKIDSTSTESKQATEKVGKRVGVHAVENSDNKRLLYSHERPEAVEKNAKNIVVWKCYLKDDSVFTAEMLDSQNEEEMKKLNQLRYPYGRVVLFIEGSTDYVLEDKAIDYRSGFPIDVFIPADSQDLWGKGEPENLFEIQDRVNRTYAKKQSLMGAFLSLLCLDKKSGIKPHELINEKGVLTLENMAKNIPQVVTNNTLSELAAINETAREYKEDAKEIGRVNEHMISGKRQKGVNSGSMVEDLNESPLTSIRSIQKKYKAFKISRSKKIITLIQQFYNVQRIIRLSEGKFASIQSSSEDNPGKIEVIDDKGKILNEIKSDLTLCEFECDITAGAEMPRSRLDKARITEKLFEQGILGQGSDAINELLTALDYPNKRVIVDKIKEQEVFTKENPLSKISELLDKFSMNFKDLPAFAQNQVLAECGIQIPNDQTQEEVEKELDLESKELDNELKKEQINEQNHQKSETSTKQ